MNNELYAQLETLKNREFAAQAAVNELTEKITALLRDQVEPATAKLSQALAELRAIDAEVRAVVDSNPAQATMTLLEGILEKRRQFLRSVPTML